jgi:cell division protein FtsW
MKGIIHDATGGTRWNSINTLFFVVLGLQIVLGTYYIFMSSAAVGEQIAGNPLFYLQRHLVCLAISVAVALWLLRSSWIDRIAGNWLLCGFIAGVLQILPLLPFLGVEALGVRRWVDMGPVTANLTPLSIVLMVAYFAGFISKYRPGQDFSPRTLCLDIAPLLLFAVPTYLQPDSGAILVLGLTLFIMLVHARRFGLCGALTGIVLVCCLIYPLAAPYGWLRLTQFLNPFADPYNSGYQLSVALSAIGGGGWSGVGVGESVIKPYLPGAQDAFILALPTEAFGVGAILLPLALTGFIIWYLTAIGLRLRASGADREGLIVLGLAGWLGTLSLLHLMIELGYAPTFSVVYPFLSYGNTSNLAALLAMAIALNMRNSVISKTGSLLATRIPSRSLFAMAFTIFFLGVGGLAIEKAVWNQSLDAEYQKRVVALSPNAGIKVKK